MYQYDVRPGFGHELVLQQPKQHKAIQVNSSSLSGSPVSFLLSFIPNDRRFRLGAFVLLAGCAVALLQGCGGVTFNPSGSAALSTLSCGTPSLAGAQSQACTVSLSAATASATTVTLTSSNAALSVPATVVIAAGSTSTGFNAVAQAVSQSVSVTISGQAGSVTKTDIIRVEPAGSGSSTAAPSLSAISCATPSLTGAQSEACTVSLSAAATSSTTVTLKSNSADLSVPATVVVQQGAVSAGFNAVSKAVSQPVSVTISGQEGSVTKTDVITLNPATASTVAPTLSTISCGMKSLTGAESEACTVSLSSAATSPTTVTLTSNNADLSVPASVVVQQGAVSAGFNAVSKAVTKSVSVTISAQDGDVTKTDMVTLNPALASAAAPTLNTISCGTQSLTGAQSMPCTVSLSTAAISPTTVTLTSSNTALTVPSTVVIAAGAASAGFNATSKGVSKSVSVTIAGQAGSVSKTEVITLYPTLATAPVLNRISCGTQTLTGAATEACSVYLSTAATGPTVVALSSSKSALTVPASVTVAAGATSTGFNAVASAVSTTQSVTLTATAGGVSLTDVLQLQATSSSQSHEVKLNWDAPSSTSDTVVGYNVYRETAGSSSYAMVSSSVDAQTSYTDTTVQSGVTYNYVVKSVDSKGVESAASNTTTVTVP